MIEEADYTCQACGETIVVPVDLSQGPDQDYVEDCPVCCRPQHLTLRLHADGSVSIEARAE